MYNTESDERSSFVNIAPYLYTFRRIFFPLTISDDRRIIINYIKSIGDFRKSFICTEGPHTERFGMYNICRIIAFDARFCSFIIGANTAERTCYFKVNAKIILHSARIPLVFTYVDGRSCLLNQNAITQRRTCFRLGIYSERSTYIKRVSRVYVNSTYISSSLTFNSERHVRIQLLQNYDIRRVMFVLATMSERKSFVSSPEKVLISTFDVHLRLDNLITERHMSVLTELTHSERYIVLYTMPCSERFTFIKLLIFDERNISLSVYRPFILYSVAMVQAFPMVSERKICAKYNQLYDERSIFLETRSIYVSKKPYSLTDTSTLMSSKDTSVNISVNSDREMTIVGTNITQQQSYNGIESGKTILTSSNKTYTISIVDYTGASISVNAIEVKKVLLNSIICNLNITII